jgi:hypothetical protein
LPKLVGKSLCAVAIHIRQQQPRAFACQAPRRCGTDAARSARDEGMNAFEAIGHLEDCFRVPVGKLSRRVAAATFQLHREICEARQPNVPRVTRELRRGDFGGRTRRSL